MKKILFRFWIVLDGHKQEIVIKVVPCEKSYKRGIPHFWLEDNSIKIKADSYEVSAEEADFKWNKFLDIDRNDDVLTIKPIGKVDIDLPQLITE